MSKVSAEEIREVLQNGFVTKASMAKNFECCVDTISNRLKELREDGVAIIHSKDGLKVVEKTDIENNFDDAMTMKAVVDWWLSMINGMQRLMIPMRPILPTMKRTLAIDLSTEEKRELVQACAKTIALITMIDAQEEIDR